MLTQQHFYYSSIVIVPMGPRLEMLQSLLDARANIHAMDNYRQNILHVATQSTPLDLLKYLVSKKLDLNIVDNYGRTPLILTISRGYIHQAKYQ